MTATIAHMSQSVLGGSPYQLDYAALRAAGYVIPEAEFGAAEDYLFDGEDASVLRNCLSSYVAQQGEFAVSAPVLTDQGAVLDGELGGLLLQTLDQTEITVAAIYQRPTDTLDQALPIIGCETGAVGNTGFGIFVSDSGRIYLSIRPGTGDPSISSEIADPIVPRGSWAFIAASMSETASTIYLGHAGSLVKATSSGVARTLADKISLGKVIDMGTSYGSHDLAIRRGIVWRSALSEADVLAAYKRAQVLSARRGWALV